MKGDLIDNDSADYRNFIYNMVSEGIHITIHSNDWANGMETNHTAHVCRK